MAHAKDITGQRFGRLVAARYERAPGGGRWFCPCDCGGAIRVPGGVLRQGDRKSCGCLSTGKGRWRDLTGAAFGRLTVVGPGASVKYEQEWDCRCECGNRRTVKTAKLTSGRTKSCGCGHRSNWPHPRREAHYKWRLDLTDAERQRTRYSEDKVWSRAVISRDGFTCQACGKRGGDLVAHHLESYAFRPELRREMMNGITLCVPCHTGFHKARGYTGFTRDDFHHHFKIGPNRELESGVV